MVKEIKYIWYGMTFNQLREVLRVNKKLRGFPLVDNPTQMILLGSVQRTELIAAIEKQVGKERFVFQDFIDPNLILFLIVEDFSRPVKDELWSRKHFL